jgi:Skp family chaperone for outer membrane proteins
VKYRGFVALLAALIVTGCAGSHSDIGLLDVSRLTSNWPKFMNASNQLNADEAAIANSRGSTRDKQRRLLQLQGRYAQLQDQLVGEVRSAAEKVAKEKNLKIVVTRENVGYGGSDITSDVEKELGFTEKASPSP